MARYALQKVGPQHAVPRSGRWPRFVRKQYLARYALHDRYGSAHSCLAWSIGLSTQCVALIVRAALLAAAYLALGALHDHLGLARSASL